MPGVVVFWLSSWAVVYDLSLAMSIASAANQEDPPMCDSKTEFGTLGNSFCGAQSFFVVAGGLGAAIWFVVVGLNLLLMLAYDYR